MTDAKTDIITGRWMYLINSLYTAHLWRQTDKGFRTLCRKNLYSPLREMLVDADQINEESRVKFCKDCRSIYRTGYRVSDVMRMEDQNGQ